MFQHVGHSQISPSMCLPACLCLVSFSRAVGLFIFSGVGLFILSWLQTTLLVAKIPRIGK